MAKRISIDPVTRIEGHLRIDCEMEGGRVSKAWSSGQMWRGIELILKDRDPREAWLFTQRICGVCTTVHAVASVRAVENALNLEIPLNAQYIRNIMIAAHAIHDHIVHFYHLSALDWVDITSALKADPKKTAALAQSLSDWKMNSPQVFREVRDRLSAFVGSGQLGIFSNGYWGHPAMTLPPEVNLMAAAHYLQALDIQRKACTIVSILGSKSPHIQNLAVGGVANPINADSPSTLTMERLFFVKSLIDELGDFVRNAYFSDVCAIAAHYRDWTAYGAGVTNYLSVPDFPTDTKGTAFDHPGGYIPGGDISKFRPIKNFQDDFFKGGVQECVKHAWYKGEWTRHPWEEETEPNYTDFQENGKYSWVKAPTFHDRPAQVGNPIADPERPLEVLRTVHSFDPCLACAIHLVDTEQREIVRVKAF